jgi:hypothetical protein
MIEVPLIEELRETRRRLAEEQELDVQRYADMLAGVARTMPGTYVTQPLLPQGPEPCTAAAPGR